MAVIDLIACAQWHAGGPIERRLFQRRLIARDHRLFLVQPVDLPKAQLDHDRHRDPHNHCRHQRQTHHGFLMSCAVASRAATEFGRQQGRLDTRKPHSVGPKVSGTSTTT
jgi:hypothetical protein